MPPPGLISVRNYYGCISDACVAIRVGRDQSPLPLASSPVDQFCDLAINICQVFVVVSPRGWRPEDARTGSAAHERDYLASRSARHDRIAWCRWRLPTLETKTEPCPASIAESFQVQRRARTLADA